MTYEISWLYPDAGYDGVHESARILSADVDWVAEMVATLLSAGRTRITIQEVGE